MRKIAIISGDLYNIWTSEYRDTTIVFIANNITEWADVDEETYELLRIGLNKLKNCYLIEHKDTTKTIEEFKEIARIEKEKQLEVERKRELNKLKAKLKKDLEQKEAKKKLYEELKLEFENLKDEK